MHQRITKYQRRTQKGNSGNRTITQIGTDVSRRTECQGKDNYGLATVC